MGRWLRTALAIAITLAILLPASASSTDSRAASSIQLGYGVMVANIFALDPVVDMGFDWIVHFLRWANVQPKEGGGYHWGDLDNILQQAGSRGLNVLIRVDRPPDWARKPGTSETGPVRPDKLGHWQTFLREMAAHARAKIQAEGWDVEIAYEIWTEPNLSVEWGRLPPDPGYYTTMLQHAYWGIKAGDPQAIVVTAGLATTGPAGMEQPPAYPQAWSDLLFIQAMYDHGAKGYFDALGSHPYGFAYPPEQDPWQVNGLAFRRAEQQRQVMVANGDGDKLIWATEWGWLLDPGSGCYDWGDWSTRTWQIVSQEQQADYLRRAFLYACRHWPWMGPMFVSNLDFSTVPWYHECEPMRWYSILNPDGSPRLAYTYLKEMPKPPCAKVYLPIAAKNYIAP